MLEFWERNTSLIGLFSRLTAPFLVTQATSSEAVDEEREAEEEMTKMQAQVSKRRLKVGRYVLTASKPSMVVRKGVGSGGQRTRLVRIQQRQSTCENGSCY
jgi:hypothetical protein